MLTSPPHTQLDGEWRNKGPYRKGVGQWGARLAIKKGSVEAMDDFDNCIWKGDISRSSSALTVRCTHTEHHQQPDWEGVCDGQVIFDANKKIKYIKLESRAVAVFYRVATAPESAAQSDGDEGDVENNDDGEESDEGDGEGDEGDDEDDEGDDEGDDDEGDEDNKIRAKHLGRKKKVQHKARGRKKNTSAVKDDVDMKTPKEKRRVTKGRIESDADTTTESDDGDDSKDEPYEASGSVGGDEGDGWWWW